MSAADGSATALKSLSSAELLATFPFPAPSDNATGFPRSLGSGDESGLDKGDGDPEPALSPADVINRLEKADLGALAAMVRACTTAACSRAALLPAALIATVLEIAIGAMMFPLDDGSFGTRQMATALACLAVHFGFSTAIILYVYLASVVSPEHAKRFAASLAQTVRWLELCDSPIPSKLVEHVPGDRFCTCRACCSGLLRMAVWDRILRTSIFQGTGTIATMICLWTPMVRFGPAFWSTWYGVLLGTVFLLSVVVWNFVALLIRWTRTSPADVRLRTRIYRRASALALRDLLARARASLLDDKPVGVPLNRELYVSLHAEYESRWRAARSVGALSSNAFTTLITFVSPFVLFACAVANIAVGSCIPFWIVCWFLINLGLLVIDLAQLPAANDQIDDVLSLYADARTALQAMLAESARLPPRPAARELREHLGLLTSLCSADNLRATFVGIVVTWGLAKTVLVTAVTVAVALWSVLRGAGVSFTIETACPSF
ncbi:hypothetical protein DFJ74DRAFT_714061 [Hyaloraphidium curvatum]|nr:hypothetical protein DFJ74DRAFT_714061 [Hyaloraphidium curvatum]